ncbi:antiviral reverse transcriptase Drt3b [Pseudomonas knackmussii]|uniref:antiviral reverse transcriptase Drt3b n=1 Tax=Pseudomonas knackmussii TaxID=65741 RepID=UPI003BC98E6B
MKNTIKLDKKDHARALLTDTAPSDVPIIFSNDGLYINWHKAEADETNNIVSSLFKNITAPSALTTLPLEEGSKRQKEQSHPLKYKIIKNQSSLRTLSLIHPRAQKNYCEFYKNYAHAIIDQCSYSKFSIRAPEKVGSSFYSYNLEPLSQYKSIKIDTLESELQHKHASSFFSYRGYDRIYKLYNSNKFLKQESKFSSMWMIDIANCFDSIYTHTISWAVKNKPYIKNFVDYRNQFCQEFDTLIQRSNNNETNGIPVGSEVSRVFSEIIFQSIDLEIEKHLLNENNLAPEKDYSILRYVDDYIIFSRNSETSELIYDTICDQLSSYNLYISESKIQKYKRPFCTEKSKAISSLKPIIDDLDRQITESTDESRKRIRRIKRRDRFFHSLIDRSKSILADDSLGYSEIASYLISTLSKRTLDLIEPRITIQPKNDDQIQDLRDLILVLLDLAFFFYSVSPSISASNKLAKTIIIIDKHFEDKYPKQLDFIRTSIMVSVNELKFDRHKNDDRNGFISLERLNIILATSSFGKNHLIPPKKFDYLAKDIKNITYFDIVSLLYYFKDHTEYSSPREELIKIAKQRLEENFELHKSSESAHIFLDIVTCPYISTQLKAELLEKYLIKYEPDWGLSEPEITRHLNDLNNCYWFVKWSSLDLISLLERKELHTTY